MKNELRDAYINDRLPCTTISEQIGEVKITQTPHAKSLKDITSEERKKEASKPIYLVRYE
jgi:hypothetical protein